jgi:hypothetical protein
MSTPHPLAAWLRDHARPILLSHFTPDCCIESTAAALDVLRAHGVACRELSVQAGVFNAPAWELYQRGILMHHGRAERMVWELKGAWSVGVGLIDDDVPRPGRFGGHLVALVEERWLLDLSIDQANRPLKRLDVPRPLLAEIPDPLQLGRGVQLAGPNGHVLVYKLAQTPWRNSYKQARPWRDRAQRAGIAREIDAVYRQQREREAS